MLFSVTAVNVVFMGEICCYVLRCKILCIVVKYVVCVTVETVVCSGEICFCVTAVTHL
jgi:hypothetical protein